MTAPTSIAARPSNADASRIGTAGIDTYDTTPTGQRRSLAVMVKNFERGLYPVIPDELAAIFKAREALLLARITHHAPETPKAARGAVLDDLMATGRLSEDYGDRVWDADHSTDRSTHLQQLHEHLAQQVNDRIPQVIGRHVDEILAGLRTSLDDIMETLRDAYRVLGDDWDLDNPDAEKVATADDATRQALVAIAEGTRTYRLIRGLQFDVLSISTQVPGYDGHRIYSWTDVQRAGLLELSGLTRAGLPGGDLGKRGAVRAVVTRPDVWMPSVDQLEQAWLQLHSIIAAAESEATATTTTQGILR